MAQSDYDFIIVGAGPSGATLASRLAGTASKPSVLLVESGGDNSELTNLIPGERYEFSFKNGAPLDYGYKSVPQQELDGREVPYARGKGLGGSSAINICLWDYGSKEEFDEWARLVDDEEWGWENSRRRFREIENLHNDTPKEFEDYVRPDPAQHGTNGPIDVSLAGSWQPGLKMLLDAARDYGLPMTQDVNSENCIGLGVIPISTFRGLRVTASTAYLSNPPDNLTIKTNSRVSRVLFDGKKAIGISCVDDVKFFAKKEVILSAGTMDTPKLLLLSGVGPAEDLAKHNIPVVEDIPGVGSNLRDHYMMRMRTLLAAGTLPPLDNDFIIKAREQWLVDQTGPLSDDKAMATAGYFKLDVSSRPEFKLLDQQTQNLLLRPSTPAYEYAPAIIRIPGSNEPILNSTIILMHSQSSGKISLASSNPEDDPLIDLRCLSHPYDFPVMLGAVEKCLDFIENSSLPTGKHIIGPESNSREDVSKFIREKIGVAWHALGTAKMGRPGEEGTCVTNDFRVVGLENLRVVDMSVCPVIPSNHTQSTAYLIGETAAQKMIREYRLDEGPAGQ